MDTGKDVFLLAEQLGALTPSQRAWIRAFVRQFSMPNAFTRDPASDVVNDLVLEHIGDLLRIHHAMSVQSLSKAPFEYAFEKALQMSGRPAALASSATNPGYDMTLGDVRISLKTEGAKGIKADTLHVSKWMEMGKGEWDPPHIQLPRFLQHLNGYDRIFTLRCVKKQATSGSYWYELVEIPKALMKEAAGGVMEKAPKTKQETSPWYCHVKDARGVLKYCLYFDAGTERKLQVRKLRKDLCKVHATWKFETEQLAAADGNAAD